MQRSWFYLGCCEDHKRTPVRPILYFQKERLSVSHNLDAWFSSIGKWQQPVFTTAVMIPNRSIGRWDSTATAASIRISESPARGKKKERSVKPPWNLFVRDGMSICFEPRWRPLFAGRFLFEGQTFAAENGPSMSRLVSVNAGWNLIGNSLCERSVGPCSTRKNLCSA